jgi:hypothetical protein
MKEWKKINHLKPSLIGQRNICKKQNVQVEWIVLTPYTVTAKYGCSFTGSEIVRS